MGSVYAGDSGRRIPKDGQEVSPPSAAPLPLAKNPIGISCGENFPAQILDGVEAELFLCSEDTSGTALSVQWLGVGGIPWWKSRNRAGIMQGMAEGAWCRSLSAINSQAEEAGAEMSALQVPLSGIQSFGQDQILETTAVQSKRSFHGILDFFSIQSSWNNPTWCVLLLRAKLKALLLLVLCQCLH